METDFFEEYEKSCHELGQLDDSLIFTDNGVSQSNDLDFEYN